MIVSIPSVAHVVLLANWLGGRRGAALLQGKAGCDRITGSLKLCLGALVML